MNRLCKIYISEIKSFFPVFGKNEKAYFEKLKTNVDNFCDEADVSTIEELYIQYGFPMDVVSNYYSFVGMDSMIKRIRLKKLINRAVIILFLISSFLAAMYWCNL